MKLIPVFLIGLIFGLGISISGMANPAKVMNFFDLAGHWDPSLAFVMGGALLVAGIGYRVIFRRPAPLTDSMFHVPQNRQIDKRLLIGSAIFGIGWGITGFCPGAAIPVIGTGNADVLLFMLALMGGILAVKFVQK